MNPEGLVSAQIRKIRGILKHEYGREFIFKVGDKSQSAVQRVSQNRAGGSIEVRLGNETIGHLYFKYGSFVKSSFVKLSSNDIYVDLGDIPAIRTAKGFERRGVATQMLSELIHLARSKKMKAVYIRVNPANPAVFLYEKFGFKVVKHINNNAREILMAYYL